MPKITAITPQKKAKNRCSIFIDGSFAFGLDFKLVDEYNLKVGNAFDPDLQKELEDRDRTELAYNGLLNYIAYRERCESEVNDWLFRKGFADLRSELIQRLKDKNYLNDERFTSLFVRDRVKLKQWGPTRLRQELMKKRIHRDTIEQAIENISEEVDFNAMAADLAARKLKSMAEPTLKDKKRIWTFLQRRGYDAGSIQFALSLHTFKLEPPS